MSGFYLKSTIKVGPLVWRWCAWPHLISSITAACSLAYYINIKDKKLMFAAGLNNLEEFLYDHTHD